MKTACEDADIEIMKLKKELKAKEKEILEIIDEIGKETNTNKRSGYTENEVERIKDILYELKLRIFSK